MMNDFEVYSKPIVHWHKSFFDHLFNIIDELKGYLPYDPGQKEEFVKNNEINDKDIFLANSTILIGYVKLSLSTLRTNSPDLVPSDSDESSKSHLLLGFYTGSITIFQNVCENELKKVRIFSNSIGNIVEQIEKLGKSFEKLKTLIETESGILLRPGRTHTGDPVELMKSEKISSYITKHSDDLMKAYTAWKNLIDDDALEAKIEHEIKESFGEI